MPAPFRDSDEFFDVTPLGPDDDNIQLHPLAQEDYVRQHWPDLKWSDCPECGAPGSVSETNFGPHCYACDWWQNKHQGSVVLAGDFSGYSTWDTMEVGFGLEGSYGAELYQSFWRFFSEETTLEEFEQWVIQNIIGPYNQERQQEAQEWNEIPEHDRLDHSYEDLRERSPEAADLVNQLGAGPDVSDVNLNDTYIDIGAVNFEELYQDAMKELLGHTSGLVQAKLEPIPQQYQIRAVPHIEAVQKVGPPRLTGAVRASQTDLWQSIGSEREADFIHVRSKAERVATGNPDPDPDAEFLAKLHQLGKEWTSSHDMVNHFEGWSIEQIGEWYQDALDGNVTGLDETNSPLSGEWADDPTVFEVLQMVGMPAEQIAMILDNPGFEEDFLRAFDEGWWEGLVSNLMQHAAELTGQMDQPGGDYPPADWGRQASGMSAQETVKCPNCQTDEITTDVCPECGKGLTPEWSKLDQKQIPFQSPPQEDHPSGFYSDPQRVDKVNLNKTDNSYPSVISRDVTSDEFWN